VHFFVQLDSANLTKIIFLKYSTHIPVKYINEKHLLEIGIDWQTLIRIIEQATYSLKIKDYSQPVKPYLRFKELSNRIIAMPAYLGGEFDIAGIKWIASFPGNVDKGIKRAHSITILNDAQTGMPQAIINTALLSGIRTASVSGFVLENYFRVNDVVGFDAGIIGFGPIGQLHLQMLSQFFRHRIRNIYLYDIQGIEKMPELEAAFMPNVIQICSSWEEVFERSAMLITCTVSKQRYIDKTPKKGGVYLNVSLRDFDASFLTAVDVNMVDNWEEICRENTDIEKAHRESGLTRSDVLEITDILDSRNLEHLSDKSFMFNPMGMAIYDMAVAKYYHDRASALGRFVQLD
jgi:N-[(2S)-2-amino-2-carboxyethyl]-L-glutamate dehydrogenase